MRKRLNLTDSKLFPMQAFFNAIPDDDFVPAMAAVISGVGRGFNDTGCLFPEDLDPGDEPFEGVQFYVLKEDLTVSRRDCAKYMRMAIESQLAARPTDAEALNSLLEALSSSSSWR